MAITQSRSLRKPTGGRYTSTNPKRLHQKASKHRRTVIGTPKVKTLRVKGGQNKKVVLRTEEINLYNAKTKKHSKAKLKVVKQNDANRNFVRRNILTKGTIVQTDKGLATITNRPGQEGFINATLKEE